MADLDFLHTFRGALDEFVVDRGLHERAARRRTALAVQRVDHEQRRIERAVDVGVVEHDDRVLAAKLEMHALQRAGPLRHDCAAGRGFADEADRLDVGMLGECAPGILAETMNGIEHAGGQTRLVRDFHEQRCGERAPFRGLVDDRAAGRERRRDLPGGEHERRIPRRDDADGPDRLADRVVELAVARAATGRPAHSARGRRKSGSSPPRATPPSTCSESAGRYPCTRRARSRRRAPRSRRRSCAESSGARLRSSCSSLRNARFAAFAARSISAAVPRATFASTELSTGESDSNVLPPPRIRFAVDEVRRPSPCRKRARCFSARARL